MRVAVISIDPSRRKSGGALLGDRIRMNAIGPWQPGPARLHALARHARLRQRDLRRPARRHRRLQGRRLRPDRGGNLGHRPGRRRDRAAGRHPDVRDDAGVRRRQPAREDRHARLRRVRGDQQVRPQGRARCAARRRQAGPAQQGSLRQEAGRDAGVRHHGRALQRRRRHGAVPGAQAAPGRTGPARCKDGRLPVVAVRHSTNQTPVVPAARTRYLAEISDTVRGYKQRAREQAKLAREIQQLQEAARMLHRSTSPTARPPPKPRSTSPASARPAWTRTPCNLLAAVAATCRRPMPATNTW